MSMVEGQNHVEFKPWIKQFPGTGEGANEGVVVFPHAGGAAAAYRHFATALADNGVDAYLVQYPQRADRLAHPAAETIEELAVELLEAGDWDGLGSLQLFGHCMGALVAFEFARLAEQRGIDVRQIWASASQAPSAVADAPRAPTTDRELVADMVDLGGTDASLLDDEDFLELLLPAVRADYQAFNRYACGDDQRVAADVHAVGGRSDHRVAQELLRRWELHTASEFKLTLFDGGHFYINDHVSSVAQLVSQR